MIIATGEAHGFEWMDFTFKDFPVRMATAATNDRSGAVRIVFPRGQGPSARTISDWQAKSPYYGSYFTPDLGFRPFDEAAEFPGRPVTYYKSGFHDFKLDEWAKGLLDIPATVEMWFEYNHWRQRVHAFARTMKDGAETVVRRKVGDGEPFRDAASRVIGYYKRNCPRIDAAAEKAMVCGTHVNALLSGLVGEGLAHVTRWLDMAKDYAIERSTSVTVPEAMLTLVPGARKVTLRRAERSSVVQIDVEMDGGHSLSDDDQGVTLRLKTQLPGAVIGSLKGKKVSQIVDLPWLQTLTVRTARLEEDALVMRVFGDKGPVALPQHRDDDADAVEAGIRELTTRKDGIHKVDDSVRPLLEGMSRPVLLAVLALLDADERVNLDPYGHPDWHLRKMSTIIQMERCPTSDIAEMLSEIGRKN